MRKICSLAARNCCFWMLFVLPIAQVARGHVDLDSPLGGESLSGGFTFPIQWHVAIQHNTENWDLWYSTFSSDGPWIEIASDLPPGDLTVEEPHFFDWQVPNLDIANAWVRVRQDNFGEDYYSVSPTSFSITAAVMGDFTGNGIVNSADLSVWQNGYGTTAGAIFSQGDDDADGDVDGRDLLRLQRNYGFGTSAALSTVPEPTSLLLLFLILGAASVLIRRR